MTNSAGVDPARAGAGLALAAGAAAGVVLVYLLAVHTVAGQTLDTRAMVLAAQHLAGAGWTGTVLALISPGAVVLATTGLGVLTWAARGPGAAAAATATVVGTVAGAAALKAVLDRPALLDGSANSLPSGHVAAVAGLAAALALVCVPTARILVAVAGLGAVATTGLATLALGWHRPSDVLASGLLAVGVAAVAGAAVPGTGATGPPSSTGVTMVRRQVPGG